MILQHCFRPPEQTDAERVIAQAARIAGMHRKTRMFGLRLPDQQRLAGIFAVSGAAVTLDLDNGIAHVNLNGAPRHG